MINLPRLAHWAALERLSRQFMPEQAWINPRLVASLLATVAEVRGLPGTGIRLVSSEYMPEDKALLVDRDGNCRVIDLARRPQP